MLAEDLKKNYSGYLYKVVFFSPMTQSNFFWLEPQDSERAVSTPDYSEDC